MNRPFEHEIHGDNTAPRVPPQRAARTDRHAPNIEGEHDFSLRSVTWGYRDLFRQTIEELYAAGDLGEEKKEVTQTFFAMMKQADQSCYDYVLKNFLQALNPRTRWVMDLPGVFAEVTETGRELAASRLYYGVEFFKAFGEGRLGDNPARIRDCITRLKRLRAIDEELAHAFLKGYATLSARLAPAEIDAFIEHGLRAFADNRRTGLQFMECALKGAEAVIQTLTRETRLQEIKPALARLLRALVGYEVEVDDLSRLDSDFLIENGSSVVCLHRWLYLPARMRIFQERANNRDWYRLQTILAAGCLSWDSFCRVQGHPRYATAADVAGDDPARQHLLTLAEYARIIERVRAHWPGAHKLIDHGLATEFERRPPVSPVDRLAYRLLVEQREEALQQIALASVNVFETAERLRAIAPEDPLYGRAGGGRLRAFAFLPDFFYPGEVGRPAPDQLVANLKEQARDNQAGDRDEGEPDPAPDSDGDGEKEGDEREATGVDACFLYDEWSQAENDYYENFCRVFERVAEPGRVACGDDFGEEARRVRQVFEKLKPELARREKYLREGDTINPERLVQHMVDRRRDPEPRIDFYERPLTTRRDLAVLLLMDTSGSTGETLAREAVGETAFACGHDGTVIDVVKRATLVLGQGLAALGDRFSICGFSTNGHEFCEYDIYKDYRDAWDPATMNRTAGARPGNATRIGAALRHGGWRLAQQPHRQRLIILVTDGKPMDAGYDPGTRYAQHDVRMACEENLRQAIHTFGISTNENSVADMEIMFPHKRFVILPDIRELPRLLPKLYIKLTV